MDKKKIKSALDSLFTDLVMMQDGRCEPDEQAYEASIDNVEMIAMELGIEVEELEVD